MNKIPRIILILILAVQPFISVQTVSAQTLEEKEKIKLDDTTSIELPTFFVKGERPLVKVRAGKLEYDVPSLIKNKPVNNAYETLSEIPGVSVQNSIISIIGASNTNIIVNGRLSSMTLDQVISMLKSTSSSKVKKIEVMYSTPPQYGVRGASINLIIEEDKSLKDMLKGETSLTATQGYYFSPKGRLGLSYTKGRFSTDVSYSLDYNRSRSREIMEAFQTVHAKDYTIEQLNRSKTTDPSHNFRGVLEYDAPDSSLLTFTYTGTFDDVNSDRTALTHMSVLDNIETNNQISGPTSLHSFRFDFTGHKGLKFGGDFVSYSDRSNQNLTNTNTITNIEELIDSKSIQKVQRGSLYANTTRKLANDWNLNYGMNGSLSKTNNESSTKVDNLWDESVSFTQDQKEINVETFAGFTKQFGEKFTLQASLSLQYYKAVSDSLQKHEVMWERFDAFPNATLGYNLNDNNNFQLSFSSDKTYPSYWQTSPSLSYMNAYAVVSGNPDLRPQRSYSGSLNYILREKYVFVTFVNHEPGNIQQMPYQLKDSLRIIYHTINLYFRDTYGLSVEVPFKIGSIVDSRLTTTGMVLHDKGLLYDVSFDRKKAVASIEMNNTFSLTKKRDFFMTVSGFYTTAPIQGVYDIHPISEVNSSLVWKISGDKAQLTLKAEDLFNQMNPHTSINIDDQNSNMNLHNYTRSISLNFTYRFSGYKKKDVKEVDASRFGNKM